ncbi:hypothetical protein V1294_006336 [Bradyrhizobium sp. AZCC 1678]
MPDANLPPTVPPSITRRFPPLPIDELVALIRSYPNCDVSSKKAIISRLVGVHPTLNLEWGPGWRFRRARKLRADERPDHVDGLIWRKDVSAALGRANPAGYQVLYVADRIDTALLETHITDDPAVISEFSVQQGRTVRIASIGELMQIQRTGRGFLSGDSSEALSSMLNACEPNEAKSLIITDAFLHECLTSHDDYDISSHVALCVFEKNQQVSVIAYSSRQHAGALCFVVRVDDFWKNWCLVAVRHIQAQHLACGMYRLREPTWVDGIFTDGRLRWSDQRLAENERAELRPPFTPEPISS